MKTIIGTAFAIIALAVCGVAQTSAKNDAGLESAMKEFINSIGTKNTTVFLSYISPEKGLAIMNTIDQGDAGNADRPTLDSTLTFKELAADFKKKGENYQNIFVASTDSPNFHDTFADRTAKWVLVAGNKFQIVDADTGKPDNGTYARWEKHGERWYVTEVGRYIS